VTLFRRAPCGDGRRYRLSMAAFNGSVDCGAVRDIIDPKRFVESCRAVSALITRLSRRSQDMRFLTAKPVSRTRASCGSENSAKVWKAESKSPFPAFVGTVYTCLGRRSGHTEAHTNFQVPAQTFARSISRSSQLNPTFHDHLVFSNP
jgi:hypothetical protein